MYLEEHALQAIRVCKGTPQTTRRTATPTTFGYATNRYSYIVTVIDQPDQHFSYHNYIDPQYSIDKTELLSSCLSLCAIYCVPFMSIEPCHTHIKNGTHVWNHIMTQ